jgi:hypothetical protein
MDFCTSVDSYTSVDSCTSVNKSIQAGGHKSISFNQLLLAKKIINSSHVLIFMNGDVMHISDDYSGYLTSAIEKEIPNIFFDNWDLTAFVNLEKQQLLDAESGNCLESLYLYTPNSLAYPHLYSKYEIEPTSQQVIVLVIDRYKINKKNLKSILEINYLDEFTFFDIIEEYKKFPHAIKDLFVDLHGIQCRKCKNGTNVDLTIFPNIHFTKCAKCRIVFKSLKFGLKSLKR